MDDLADRLRAMAATPGMGIIGAGLSAYQEREIQRLLVKAADALCKRTREGPEQQAQQDHQAKP